MSDSVKIHHQDGETHYTVARAQFGFINGNLYLEIDASPSTDHHLSFLGKISIELNDLNVGGESINTWPEKEFWIPTSLNNGPESETDRFTNFYLGEHYDIDQNDLVFKASAGGQIKMLWTGFVPDPRYYDDRAKDCRIEIQCILSPDLFRPQ